MSVKTREPGCKLGPENDNTQRLFCSPSARLRCQGFEADKSRQKKQIGERKKNDLNKIIL